MISLVRSLLPDGPALLKSGTIAQLMTNQLPPGVHIRFPGAGEVHGKGFGLAGAVTLEPSPIDPRAPPVSCNGVASRAPTGGSRPRPILPGLVMTQRQMAFWHPFSFEFKLLAHRVVGW